MRYCALDAKTDTPVPLPQSKDIPPGIKFMYLPRIRCHDCPGKLYTPGPEMTAVNFEVHLRNRHHREKVEQRLANAGLPPPGPLTPSQAAGHAANGSAGSAPVSGSMGTNASSAGAS
jgi:SWI/SNF-related matrix-associated actin-dependent regulator of chromatin subfamily B member 1